MAKYFINEYKNYYDAISNNVDIEAKYNDLVNKLSSFNTSLNNYSSFIEGTLWKEKGKTELLYSYLPIINKNVLMVESYVVYDLNNVISLVKNDLFGLLSSLKEEDEKYCTLKEKQDAKETTDAEEVELNNYLKSINQLIKDIDNKILEIKNYKLLNASSNLNVSALENLGLDKSLKEFLDKYKSDLDGDVDDKIMKKLVEQLEYRKSTRYLNGNGNELETGNCIDLALLGNNWKVINTSIPVLDYATLAYNKGIRQNSNSERYSDLCLAFSYVHASNMYNGTTTDTAESAYNWKHAGEFTDYYNDSKQETLEKIYDEIKDGKPVIMQVNGNTSGTSRHFVTVVGIKNDVKSAQDVKESDLLVLDSWDGKLETMDSSTSRFMTTGKETNKSYSGYYLRVLE